MNHSYHYNFNTTPYKKRVQNNKTRKSSLDSDFFTIETEPYVYKYNNKPKEDKKVEFEFPFANKTNEKVEFDLQPTQKTNAIPFNSKREMKPVKPVKIEDQIRDKLLGETFVKTRHNLEKPTDDLMDQITINNLKMENNTLKITNNSLTLSLNKSNEKIKNLELENQELKKQLELMKRKSQSVEIQKSKIDPNLIIMREECLKYIKDEEIINEVNKYFDTLDKLYLELVDNKVEVKVNRLGVRDYSVSVINRQLNYNVLLKVEHFIALFQSLNDLY